MIYLVGLFDYKYSQPKIAAALVYDGEKFKLFKFYLNKSGTTLEEVENNKKELAEIINSANKIISSEFKLFIQALNLNFLNEYDVWELPTELVSFDINNYKSVLGNKLKTLIKTESLLWNNILGKSHLVYSMLETVKYWDGNSYVSPFYDFTFTGRSKTMNHNIQGSSELDDIRHGDLENNNFVCFDWISIDIRIAAYISNDDLLKSTFENSDPYQFLMEKHGILDRDLCKTNFLANFYNLNVNNELINSFPDFANWMSKELFNINDVGFSKSILGRVFTLSDERNVKSVFNAQVQGSVAHIMQNVIYQIYKKYAKYLLTEVHDSIILAVPDNRIDEVINNVSGLMVSPLTEVIDKSERFPVKISVGQDWKKWEVVKVIR